MVNHRMTIWTHGNKVLFRIDKVGFSDGRYGNKMMDMDVAPSQITVRNIKIERTYVAMATMVCNTFPSCQRITFILVYMNCSKSSFIQRLAFRCHLKFNFFKLCVRVFNELPDNFDGASIEDLFGNYFSFKSVWKTVLFSGKQIIALAGKWVKHPLDCWLIQVARGFCFPMK